MSRESDDNNVRVIKYKLLSGLHISSQGDSKFEI